MDELFFRVSEADVKGARPSIAPEKLLRAMLLQILFSIQSERQFMEQTQYNMLFRWFIGLAMEDSVWVPTVFSKNRQRLIEHDAVVALFNELLETAENKDWLPGEHFSVDGMLMQAWAGDKSFVRKDGGGDAGSGGGFKGPGRSNDTHGSRTDPDSNLYGKGKTGSELRYMGTRSPTTATAGRRRDDQAGDGFAEREAAKVIISDARQATASPDTQITFGADKGYHAAEFIKALHRMKVTPHVPQIKSGRRSAVADELAQSEGYAISQRKRKFIEQGFGWAKFVGPIRQVMVRGIKKVDQLFVLTMAAYTLVRMRTLAESVRWLRRGSARAPNEPQIRENSDGSEPGTPKSRNRRVQCTG
jgi:transposase